MSKKRSKQNKLSLVLIVVAVLVAVGFGYAYYHGQTKTPATVKSASSFELLSSPVVLSGKKSVAKATKATETYDLSDKNALHLTYNLHGLCALLGDSSSITFNQENTSGKLILARYGENCFAGEQTVLVPLAHIEGLDKHKPITSVEFSFWYPAEFQVDVSRLTVSAVEEEVLGATTDPVQPEYHKTFPNVTPLRPYPYAQESLE